MIGLIAVIEVCESVLDFKKCIQSIYEGERATEGRNRPLP
jgi:hypothetical protein